MDVLRETSIATNVNTDYKKFVTVSNSLPTIFVDVEIHEFIFCIYPNILSKNFSKNIDPVLITGKEHKKVKKLF